VKRLSESITSDFNAEGRRYVLSPVPETLLQVPYPRFQMLDSSSLSHTAANGNWTYQSGPPPPPPSGGDYTMPAPPPSPPPVYTHQQGDRVSYTPSKSSEGSSSGRGGSSSLDSSFNRTPLSPSQFDSTTNQAARPSSSSTSSKGSNRYDHNGEGSAGGKLGPDDIYEDGGMVFGGGREVKYLAFFAISFIF